MSIIRVNLRNCLLFIVIASFIYLAFLIWTAKDRVPEFEVQLRDVLSYVVLAVEMGGHAIVRTFQENKQIQFTEKSQMDVGRAELLTKADLISNHLMLTLLGRFPFLKIISEEKSEFLPENEIERYRADNYELWLGLREALSKFPSWRIPLARVTVWIDPLDATQEFTEGLTQFVTVMACVAIDGKPIFGAIHSPFNNETVFGMVDHGLFDSNGLPINLLSSKSNRHQQTILVSRTHAGTVSDLVRRAFANDSTAFIVEPAGGAGYKTLRLIRQSADLYIHTTTIKKWDLCAGDALIRSAGGALLSLDNGLPIDYSVDATALKSFDRNKIHKNAISANSEMAQPEIMARNQLALRHLFLLEQFFELNKSVQCILDDFRLNLVKAKSTSTAFAVGSVAALLSSQKEMSPTIWVQTVEAYENCPTTADCALFALNWPPKQTEKGGENVLRKRADGTTNEKEKSANANSEQKCGHSNFRPFGIFENHSVKATRKNIETLLPILCDLANIQRQILTAKEADERTHRQF